ncbi:MAG: CerR family C-terminal domain-containing protein [Planctomycetes bacterium]|nr:CerR family C-terminal domain-containing protein [Planctomycetota bacterium]
MPSDDKPLCTRQRLLESAAVLFAQKGYAAATVAEICQSAEANSAAVNYYFRSKENLYAEAWRLAFQRSLRAHPLDGGIGADAGAEDRLRGLVLSTVRRITDPRGHEFDILERERGNPTGLLAEIMRKSIEPVRRHLDAIVRELLGERAAERHVVLCRRSIMGQCMHLMHRDRAARKAAGDLHGQPDLDVLAEHIVRFSLAGIRDMRRRIESGEDDGRS